jgi:hypothetical protein
MTDKINIVLDATMLDTFMMCECKFNYRFNLNKVPPDKAPQLDRGSLLHLAFETYFTELKNRVEFKERLAVSLSSIDQESIKTEFDAEEVEYLKRVFTETCNVFRDRDEQMEILAVEKPFIYLLHEDDVIKLYMIGKIDLLVNEPGYDNLPYDHKSYERDYPLDRKANQFCNYTYATGSNYLIVNRVGMQTSIIPVKKHKRIPLSYDPIFLDGWKKDVIKWAYRYLDCVINNDWPRNTTSCNKFNRICEYDNDKLGNVCSSSGTEAKLYKLETFFDTAERWDVSKSLGDRK